MNYGEYDVIGFELLNVLVTLPGVSENGYITFLSKKINDAEWLAVRRKSEALAKEKYGVGKYSIDQIYTEYKTITECSNATIKRLKNTEIDFLTRYLQPRKYFIDLARDYHERGKKIFLVANAFFTKSFVSKIISKLNANFFEKVYFLYELTDFDQRLYEDCWDLYKSKNIKILGNDNSIYSKLVLSEANVELIPSVYQQLKDNRKLGQLYNNYDKQFQNDLLIGFSACKLFDNPYVEYANDSYFNGEIANMTDFLLAPFFLTYSVWMANNCKKDNIETLIWVYRDGYLLERIFDLFEKYSDFRIMSRRIYLTRAVCNIMYANQQNGLYESLTHMLTTPQMTVADFISNRLMTSKSSNLAEYNEILNIFLDNGYLSEEDTLDDRDKLISLSKKLQPFFDKNVGAMKSVVEEYCKDTCLNTGKTALFDVGYRGSACKFLKNYFDIDSFGYHLFSKEEMTKNNSLGLNIKAPIKYGLKTEQTTFLLNVLTEDLLNAPEPTVIGITKTDKKYVLKREENWQEQKKITEIQEYIIKYAADLLEMTGSDIWAYRFDIHNYFEFYKRFLRSANIDRKIFSDMVFCDSGFMNSNAINVYEKWANLNNKKSVGDLNKKAAVQVIPQVTRSTLKTKIYNKLKEKGMLQSAKKIVYKAQEYEYRLLKDKIAFKNSYDGTRVLNEMKNSINEILSGIRYRTKSTLIICGHIVAFDKGTCNYVNKLSKLLTNTNVLLVSEVPYINDIEVRRKIKFDFKIMRKVPMRNSYDKNVDIPLCYEVGKLISEKKYLQDAVISMEKRFPDMGLNYAKYLAWYLYTYYSTLIDTYQTERTDVSFLVWNQFTTMHTILSNVCKEKKVKVAYLEFGVFPGTFNIDITGQMGESQVALDKESFESVEITKKEYENTKITIDVVRKACLNRNPQPYNNKIDEIKKKLKPDRPIILYFGQNDYESGLFPYNDITKEFHSPFFKSSDEAALALDKISNRLDYNLIYKPHPTMCQLYGQNQQFSSSTIVVDDVDINEIIDLADVCCTILSQSAYISLIRKKPVVMLGYTQLKNRDFVYQLEKKDSLEKVLTNALNAGLTEKMYEEFVRHIARCNKTYLYNDLTDPTINWGQTIQSFVEALKTDLPIESDKKTVSREKLKIAVCSQMPVGKYSGGRSHAWNIGEALAMQGNKIYFLANNTPIFSEAMDKQKGHNNILFVKTNVYSPSDVDVAELDYVFLIPHRDINENYYYKVRKFAITKNAKLILLNYESGNWVNKYLNNELNMEFWTPWKNVCNDGCLVLSSDIESQKYAKEFYLNNPQYTKFDYWYPPINSFAAEQVKKIKKENQIVALIRLGDKYKGSFDILDMIDDNFKGYKFVFIYGSAEEDDNFVFYKKVLEAKKAELGIDYEIKKQLSDYDKFIEISKSKLLLFPSYFEGYGTPPIEALYCQTDCVAYDLPVLRETCKDYIYYAKYGDVDDLRKKALLALNRFDEKKDKRHFIYEIANFEIASKALDEVLHKYLNIEWRDESAVCHI